jgi:glutaredoxin
MKKMLWIMIVAVALMSGCGNKEADEAAKTAEAAKAQADKATAEAAKATEAAKAQADKAITEANKQADEAKAQADKAVADAAKAADKAVEAKVEDKAVEAKVEDKAVEAKVEDKAVEAKVEDKAVEAKVEDKAVETAAAGGGVELQFFIMSQCPFGVQVMDGVIPALQELGSAVDFKVDFIGKVEGDTLTSMHGENEVKGNIIEACVIKHAPDKWMDFFLCVDKNYRALPGNWNDCAKTAGLTEDQIKASAACYEGDEGQALMKASFEKAEKAGARGSPTIHLAGEPYRGGRTKRDFMVAICDATKGEKPEVCATIPPPIKVTMIVVGDKRCTDRKCNTAPIVGSLKGIFPGLDVTEHDWADEAGKKVYEEYGLSTLPAFVFDEKVKEAAGHQRISRYLQPTKVEGFLNLQIGATHDPKAEICDNGVDDTGNGLADCADETCKASMVCREEIKGKVDVFVMSQCPFGVKALDAMKEVLDAFKGEITFEVHFIASEEGDGFKALHGQPEVDENIRELCAITHYGADFKYMDYIWCRNGDIRSAEWVPCAEKAGMDVAKMKACAEGDEGKELLRKDIKIGAALGFSASPTWLANNKHKFSGVDPKTIQTNICQHNPDLKGCKAELSGPQPRKGGGNQGGGSCG